MPLTATKNARPVSHYQVALVLLAVLPLIAVFGVIAWQQSENLRDSINRGMLANADALSLAVEGEVATIREGLQTLADTDAIDRRDFEAVYREALQLASRRQGAWIVLTHRSGQYLLNTSLPYGTPLPNRFRENLEAQPSDALPLGTAEYIKKVFETGKPNNSSLFTSIVHRRAVLAVNVPVIRGGSVDYAFSITFEPDEITQLLRKGLYDESGGVALLDANNFIISRSRDPEKFIGRKAPASLAIPADAPPRGLGSGTTVDGRVIYQAYPRSPVTGWVVSAGVLQQDLEKRIAADRSRTALVGFAGLAIGIVLALWFAYRLRLPMIALAAKAAGTPVPRAEGFVSSELVDINCAIDAAAEAREAQAKERDLRIAAEARKEESDAANRGKDQFLAMLGHELRNPLAAITNAVTVMEQAPALSVSMTPIVKRQSEHLRKLVDDLLDVARVTSGKIRLITEDVDLLEIAQGCAESFVSTGRSAHHDVTVSGESVLVHADRHRLQQVCTNLIDNALKFTPHGGRITVTVSSTAADAVLEVKDTGSGIARENLGRIFEVFAQGESVADRSRTGLGLGLALARSLVEMQHGTIAARSAGPGEGATFTVTLPRVHAKRAADDIGPRAANKIGTRRVLLVEDQVDTRNALRHMLELDGHQVTEAADGQSAIARARAVQPEVAFVDIGLPDIDGYEVARALRADQTLRGIRLVALTGYGMPDDRAKALQIGFDAFVVKPIERETLREMLG